ncbi:MAG: hypothetical protein DWQ44_11805 [Bacteroidetes bacterium]|nr:MAG: hypothetical protein DWQ33_10765 [Bacteroidota bacterium]REK32710.1 MAG: hypothetical protein DWQ44_11805 [Bacteroidota bacterium]
MEMPRYFSEEISNTEKWQLLTAEDQNPGLNYHPESVKTFGNVRLVVEEPFPFNPNEIDNEAWQKLGMAESKIRTLRKYLNNGGKFRIKSDLMKVYGMEESLYNKLFPFILLPDSIESVSHIKKPEPEARIRILELNTSDSAALTHIKGIGPVFAGRIVKYRNRLGGFFQISQLKEVYGLSDTLFDVIKVQLEVDSNQIQKKININESGEQDLASHPYIGKKMAKLIINYRNQHQRFSGIEELRNIPLLNEENFRKLAPYLKTD